MPEKELQPEVVVFLFRKKLSNNSYSVLAVAHKLYSFIGFYVLKISCRLIYNFLHKFEETYAKSLA